SEEMAAIGQWDRKDQPTRGAAELVEGLQKTFAFVQECLARYTPADLDYTFSETYQGEDYTFSRQWVIWHVIEHDLHHGGEVSLTLGIHQLAAPDL
ncbi:MAG TPA: DinB family protein, partial [Ktedonobacteraceae bacterium]|nr:DinB family protein [Ktedonobacteraceae bacterium]